MMRSMYSGVSGLRTHQLKMDVIGNNIANVNTPGFKRSQISFQEVFSQTSSGASAPQGGRGGTNPQQVGLGVNVGSIRVIHDPGSAQRTDYALDFSIAGDGYFVVSGDSNFNNRSYTRAGNFDLDRDGTLVTGEGLKVLGYTVNDDGSISDTLSDIQIDKSSTVQPTATENMSIKGNIDSRTPMYETNEDGTYKLTVAAAAETGPPPVPAVVGGERIALPESQRSFSTDSIIYDSLGNSYTITYKISKPVDPTANRVTVDPATATDTQYEDALKAANILWAQADNANNWEISVASVKDSQGKKIAGTSITPGSVSFGSDGKLTSSKELLLEGLPNSNGGKFEDPIKVDISGLTQYGNDTTAKAYKEDGNTSGVIDSFSVSRSGEIVAVYTNGESKVLAQLALAKFDNPGGLSKEGSNLFKDTRNSGEPQYGKAGNSGYGQILGGSVEMSNVDLSNEFTEMITTQRGFQANSRIITTSDEMLQELVNLKR